MDNLEAAGTHCLQFWGEKLKIKAPENSVSEEVCFIGNLLSMPTHVKGVGAFYFLRFFFSYSPFTLPPRLFYFMYMNFFLPVYMFLCHVHAWCL